MVLALISSAFFGCGIQQFVIFCIPGLCLFEFSMQYIDFLVAYSLSLGCIMSSNKLESFPFRFTGKNYSAWEFQFKLFVKGKELWGHIDGSVPHLKVPRLCLSGKFMMLRL